MLNDSKVEQARIIHKIFDIISEFLKYIIIEVIFMLLMIPFRLLILLISLPIWLFTRYRINAVFTEYLHNIRYKYGSIYYRLEDDDLYYKEQPMQDGGEKKYDIPIEEIPEAPRPAPQGVRFIDKNGNTTETLTMIHKYKD